MISITDSLTFSDLLLVPQYSEISSRSDVDVSVSIGDYKFTNPIIPANMKSITGSEMAAKVSQAGGLAIVHRFMSLDEQLDIAIANQDKLRNIGFSLGVQGADINNARELYNVGVRIFCIDIAHGDSKHCIEMIHYLKDNLKGIFLIAGNIATGSAAKRLWDNGADVVKVGIGSGAICSTRIQTGNGTPQITALMDVATAKENFQKHHDHPCGIISDGGILSAGDCVKALVFADMVMTGKLFAGCSEAPGEVIYKDGVAYKQYAGSSTLKANHVEGVVATITAGSDYKQVLKGLVEGIRSGCSYQGVNNLVDLKSDVQFVKMSSAGLEESKPHLA